MQIRKQERLPASFRQADRRETLQNLAIARNRLGWVMRSSGSSDVVVRELEPVQPLQLQCDPVQRLARKGRPAIGRSEERVLLRGCQRHVVVGLSALHSWRASRGIPSSIAFIRPGPTSRLTRLVRQKTGISTRNRFSSRVKTCAREDDWPYCPWI